EGMTEIGQDKMPENLKPIFEAYRDKKSFTGPKVVEAWKSTLKQIVQTADGDSDKLDASIQAVCDKLDLGAGTRGGTVMLRTDKEGTDHYYAGNTQKD